MKKEKLKWSEMTKKQKVIHIIDCILKSVILLIIGACIVYGIAYNAKDRGKVAKADTSNLWTSFDSIEGYFNNSTINAYWDNAYVKNFNISSETEEIETPRGKRIINKKNDVAYQNLIEIKTHSAIPSKRICADLVHFLNSIYTLTSNTYASVRIGDTYYEYKYDNLVMKVDGINFFALSEKSVLDLYSKCTQVEDMYIVNRSGEFARISIPTNLVSVKNQPVNVYNYSFKTMAGNESYQNFVGNFYNGVYATGAGYVYDSFKVSGQYGVCVDTTNNNLYITGNYIVNLSDRSTIAKSFMEGIAPEPYYLARGYNTKPSESAYLYITGGGPERGILSVNQVEPGFTPIGYQEMYDKGYNAGYMDGSKNATGFNPVGMMIEPVAKLLDVKLFGEFSIGNFFTAALFVTLAMSFIKMFAGG